MASTHRLVSGPPVLERRTARPVRTTPESNFGLANRALVARVPIPAANVHRILGELPDAWDAARAYEEATARRLCGRGSRDLTFDVMLLGLGEDAHIASIFPDTAFYCLRGCRQPAVAAVLSAT